MIPAMIVAWFLSYQCPEGTAWWESHEDSYRAVCGDEDGNPVSYPRLLPDTGIVVYVVADEPRLEICELNGWDRDQCDLETRREMIARGLAR